MSPREVTPPSIYAEPWRTRSDRWQRVAPMSGLGVSSGSSVLFVGAHPDDETLAAGGTLASLGAGGAEVHVVSLTAGEAALAHVGATVPDLAARRTAEFARACAILEVTTSQVLDFADGGLEAQAASIDRSLDRLAATLHPTTVLAVWWDDPHPDHRAAGQAARRLANRLDCGVTGFPIWAQHWSCPTTAPRGDNVHVMAIEPAAAEARQRASFCYETQLLPLDDSVEPVVPPSVREWDLELAMST